MHFSTEQCLAAEKISSKKSLDAHPRTRLGQVTHLITEGNYCSIPLRLNMRRALGIARRLQAVRATAGDAAQVCSGSGRCFAAESSGDGLAPIHLEDELYCRQRQQLVLGNRIPDLSPDVWLAPNAIVIGDVDLFDRVCCFFFVELVVASQAIIHSSTP